MVCFPTSIYNRQQLISHIMNVLNKIKSKSNKPTPQSLSESSKQQILTRNQIVQSSKQSKTDINQTLDFIMEKQKKSVNKINNESANGSNILNKINKSAKKEQIITSVQQVKQQAIISRKKQLQSNNQMKMPSYLQKNKNKSKQKGEFKQKIQNNYSRELSSQFSDDILSNGSSIPKIVSISKQFKWANPEYECQKSQNLKASKIQNNNIQFSKQKQQNIEMPKPQQYTHMFVVKKGFLIGRMSIFQGILQNKKTQNKSKMTVRTRQPITTKISCKTELIPNPQSISHIYMKRIVEIGDKEYLVGQNGIVKVIQKTRNTR